MQSDFITDKNLYVDVAGNLVDENDPTKLTKIAAAGSRVAPGIVEKYGLSTPAPTLKGKLPDDFPGRSALEAAGLTTYARVRKELAADKPFDEVGGIGPATEQKIRDAMDEAPEDEEESE